MTTTLLPPGSPAVTLPAYKAPPFAQGAGPLPGFDIIGPGTGGYFTVGQVFKQGALAPSEGLSGMTNSTTIPLQVDVKATWPDGSVFHAVISGVIPPGTAPHLQLARAQKQMGTLSRVSPQSAYRVDIIDQGVTYTAQPFSLGTPWLAGPVSVELSHFVPFVDASLNKHPVLQAQFNIRDYADNSKVDITIEYSQAYVANTTYLPAVGAAPLPACGDVTYDAKMSLAGETRYEKVALTHFHAARWKKTFWLGAKPALWLRHDLRYFIDTMAVSNYAPVTPNETYLASLVVDGRYDPMKPGRMTGAMGTTGGRPEIGLMPDSYAAYLVTWDPRAYKQMLAQADQGGSWCVHRRDASSGPASGQPMDVIHWQRSTILGNFGDAINPLTGKNERLHYIKTSAPTRPDDGHEPAFAYLPYLLTGDLYYLEEMLFWNNWNMINANCAYRGYHKGAMAFGQIRSQAWNIRSMAQCAAAVPDDHPAKAAAHYFLDNTMASYIVSHVTPPVPGDTTGIGRHHTVFGADGNGAIYPEVGGNSQGVAPWQDDFEMQAFNHAYELTKNPAVKIAMLWKSKFVVGRMLCPLHDGVDAATYSLRVRETAAGPFYTTIEECYLKTFLPERYSTPVGSAERLAYLISRQGAQTNKLLQGEIIGNSGDVQGFPSQMQPALAAAVDIGAPGAAEAWARFAARPNKPNYALGPQFGIEPRAAVVVPPPVVVEPPPVVTPPVVVPPVEPPPVVTPPPVTTPPVEPPPVVVPQATPRIEFSDVAIESSLFKVGESYAVTITTAAGAPVAMRFPVVAK